MTTTRSLVTFILLVATYPALADTLNGHVVGVADGDTMTLLDASRQQHKIRVMGIDAPEKAQAFGNVSKTSLSAIVFDRVVRVDWTKRDRYQRIVGKVIVLDNPGCQGPGCPGVDAGLEQVRAGMAWWYRAYSKEQTPVDQTAYQEAEFNAQIRRQGLWSDDKPVPPWEWRRER